MRGNWFAANALALAALPVSAQAADTCATHAERGKAIEAKTAPVFDLMKKRDLGALKASLPILTAELAQLPAAKPAPLKCGDEVQVYDPHQFAQFVTLQKAGKPVRGYAKGTRFAHFEPHYYDLAYAVGWIQYELGDFEAARIAYAKGLAIAPNQHDLINEYVAVLLNQKKNAELTAFVDRFLASDTDMEADKRASLIAAKGISQLSAGDRAGALKSAEQAKVLDHANEHAKMLLDALK